MRHRYLFDEGEWGIGGTYFDPAGHGVPVEGRAVVSHEPGQWLLEGAWTIMSEPPVEVDSRYEIVPFGETSFTTWTANDPVLGWLNGSFTVVGDTILSTFTTDDGQRGMEAMRQVGDSAYENRGALIEGERPVSTWSLHFTRRS